jgi:hypothetical protein
MLPLLMMTIIRQIKETIEIIELLFIFGFIKNEILSSNTAALLIFYTKAGGRLPSS